MYFLNKISLWRFFFSSKIDKKEIFDEQKQMAKVNLNLLQNSRLVKDFFLFFSSIYVSKSSSHFIF